MLLVAAVAVVVVVVVVAVVVAVVVVTAVTVPMLSLSTLTSPWPPSSQGIGSHMHRQAFGKASATRAQQLSSIVQHSWVVRFTTVAVTGVSARERRK